MGRPEGRRPLGRPRRRWVDNIRMDLVEVGQGDVGWAYSTNGEKRNAYRLLVGGHYEDQYVGGWIILGWILYRWDGVMRTGLV
jgi:hypothetical protein